MISFFFFRRAWQADSWSNPRLNKVIEFLNFEMSESKRRWIWKFVERDVEDMLKFCTIIFWIRFSWVDKLENDWENSVFNNSKSELWKKEKKKEKVANEFKSLERTWEIHECNAVERKRKRKKILEIPEPQKFQHTHTQNRNSTPVTKQTTLRHNSPQRNLDTFFHPQHPQQSPQSLIPHQESIKDNWT